MMEGDVGEMMERDFERHRFRTFRTFCRGSLWLLNTKAVASATDLD